MCFIHSVYAILEVPILVLDVLYKCTSIQSKKEKNTFKIHFTSTRFSSNLFRDSIFLNPSFSQTYSVINGQMA